ncbi:MAG: HAD family phosphatase [Paludibacteraceae bacterium]|nr:HAD family phosphatase [Paludibacteraceae bacterium]
MIKNIVFDFGGVLIDADLEAVLRSFRSMGIDNISEYINLYRQNGLFLDLEDGTKNKEEFNEALCAMTGRNIPDEAIASAWLAIVERVDPNKLLYLEELRKKYKLYLLSNINPYVFEWAETPAFSELGQPIHHYFDKMFASYQLKMTKPSQEIFEHVLRSAGIKAEETLFVDDGAKNVATAESMDFHVYQPQNREDWRGAVAQILSEQNGI